MSTTTIESPPGSENSFGDPCEIADELKTNNDSNNNYSGTLTDKVQARLEDAVQKCWDLVIDFDGIHFDWHKAAKIFTTPTLWKVFVLLQILETNQPCTVRSAMYKGIGLAWENSDDENYRTCNRLILEMRRSGLIPYSYIVDGTRSSFKPSSWSGLEDFAESCAQSYRKDLWARQRHYIEVFCEKDAMTGVIRPVTEEYDVTLRPMRGYGSETFLYNIAELWKKITKPIHVYYLGDHDPSGLAIEKNILQRLAEFTNKVSFWNDDYFVEDASTQECVERGMICWHRLGVTDEDFDNPEIRGFEIKKAKSKGSATKNAEYIDLYGTRCVEVDAIPAPVIRERVQKAIESWPFNTAEWNFLKAQEERERVDVLQMVRNLNNCSSTKNEGTENGGDLCLD